MKKLLFIISLLSLSCKENNHVKPDIKTKSEHQIIFEIRESLFKTLPVKPNQNIFIGHSIIQYANWDELLPEKPIINRGIGGAFIPGITKIVKSEINHKPKTIILMAGVNDLGNGVPIKKIKADYLDLFSELKKHPKVPVYYLSLMPWKTEHISVVKDLNSFAKKNCTSNIVYIDLFTQFADSNDTMMKHLTIDGVHLSGEGYEKLCAIISPLL